MSATRRPARASCSNAQPILIDCAARPDRASATTATSVNARELHDELVRQGSIFQSGSDTEVILHLIRALPGAPYRRMRWWNRCVRCRSIFAGDADQRSADRGRATRTASRPLALGRLRAEGAPGLEHDAWVVCSETCAHGSDWRHLRTRCRAGRGLDHLGRRGPVGETISAGAAVALRVLNTSTSRGPTAMCSAKASMRCAPSSVASWRASSRPGRTWSSGSRFRRVRGDGFRRGVGRAAAHGVDSKSLRRPHLYSAAAVDPALRREGQAEPGARSILDGKRVILVDDSIVRGTTSRKIVRMVRAAGAKGVHVRISCPPTISPCFYGVDTPRKQELIAATHTLTEIRDFLECRQHRLPESRRPAHRGRPRAFVTAASCYTGIYPVEFPQRRGDVSSARVETGYQGSGSEVGMSAADSTRPLLRLLCILCVLCVVHVPSFAQEPPAPQAISPAQLKAAIDKLSDLDYAVRMNASRTIRRAQSSQAVQALLQTVAEHGDGYVRYRALVLLTGFNDPRTKDAMRESLKSPNDRLRAVAYSFSSTIPTRRCRRSFSRRSRKSRASSSGQRWSGRSPPWPPESDNATLRQAVLRDATRGEDFFRSVRRRSARRLQGAVRVRDDHTASPSSTDHSRTMRHWRSEKSRDKRALRHARGIAAQRAADDPTVDRCGDLPAGNQLQFARELPD